MRQRRSRGSYRSRVLFPGRCYYRGSAIPGAVLSRCRVMRVVVDEDTDGWRLDVVVLTGSNGPEEGSHAESSEDEGNGSKKVEDDHVGRGLEAGRWRGSVIGALEKAGR